MIKLKRLPEPPILAQKKAEWKRKYEAKRAATANAKLRPESKQYAHPQIVATLEAMSHRKCFYCEADGKMSVDHYIELAERGDLAFDWENLYLACDGCQEKLFNTSIPVADCVDPCDPATNPTDHLEFEDEYVTFRTPRGDQTIRKYKLNRPPLVSERRRVLRDIAEALLALSQTQGWQGMDAAARQRFLAYAKADSPFSLTCRAYLDKKKIADG